MIVRGLYIGDSASRLIFPLSVSRFCKPHFTTFDQPDLMIRVLGAVLDPPTQKNDPVGNEAGAASVFRDHSLAFQPQGFIEPLVRVEMEYPRVGKWNVIQGESALSAKVVKCSLENLGPRSSCDFAGRIGTEGVKDDDIATPADCFDAVRDVLLFVFRQYEDREHGYKIVSFRDASQFFELGSRQQSLRARHP